MKFLDEPTLNSVLPIFEYYLGNKIKCFGIGKVQAVNTEKGTVDVKLVMRPTLNKVSEKPLKEFDDNGKHTSPILENVPILMSHVTKPLNYGDNVLLAFNDYNIGKWYKTDDYVNDIGEIKHTISNAIAIAGLDSLKNSTFIQPEDYKPAELPSSLMDSPFSKYGYDNENACLHWGNGDVRAGAWGVTITSRDSSNVNIYSENGSVNVYPTNCFHVNTGVCHFQVSSFPMAGALEGLKNEAREKQQHRITMYSTVKSKKITAKTLEEQEELAKEGLEVGDRVYTSDIYRILRYMRACIKDIANFIGSADFAGELASGDEQTAGQNALLFALEYQQNLNELSERINGLFAPAEPVKEE